MVTRRVHQRPAAAPQLRVLPSRTTPVSPSASCSPDLVTLKGLVCPDSREPVALSVDAAGRWHIPGTPGVVDDLLTSVHLDTDRARLTITRLVSFDAERCASPTAEILYRDPDAGRRLVKDFLSSSAMFTFDVLPEALPALQRLVRAWQEARALLLTRWRAGDALCEITRDICLNPRELVERFGRELISHPMVEPVRPAMTIHLAQAA